MIAGLDVPSLPMTGFGTGWFDFDNDGDLDLLAVNGAVRRLDRDPIGEAAVARSAAKAEHERQFGQPNQLFRNLGGGRFEEVSELAGPPSRPSRSPAERRSAMSTTTATPTSWSRTTTDRRLLVNLVGQDNGWIGLRLLVADGKRDALGSLVRVVLDDGRVLVRRVRADDELRLLQRSEGARRTWRRRHRRRAGSLAWGRRGVFRAARTEPLPRTAARTRPAMISSPIRTTLIGPPRGGLRRREPCQSAGGRVRSPRPGGSRSDRESRTQVRSLEKADANDADLASAVGELGKLYHALQLLDSHAFGALQAAAHCYGEARRLDPSDHRWPYLMAFAAQNQGDLDPAASAYRAALEREPEMLPGPSPAGRNRSGPRQTGRGGSPSGAEHSSSSQTSPRALRPRHAGTRPRRGRGGGRSSGAGACRGTWGGPRPLLAWHGVPQPRRRGTSSESPGARQPHRLSPRRPPRTGARLHPHRQRRPRPAGLDRGPGG